ncbi:MAG: prepilin-type N-terminal cleavage/methylation domain-containing protein [Desulfobacteraceae bacterium]|nr:MAG: prepilin-type N-terminal cleavage/methylation domain-containing protein [Desulfobacteraceae bacterium]
MGEILSSDHMRRNALGAGSLWSAGFTLLEMMISVLVLVMVMSALYGAYNSSVDSVEIAREGGDIRQTARLILERLSVELECALADGGLAMVGRDMEINGLPADQISFFSTAGGGNRERRVDLFRLTYTSGPDPGGDGLILTRTEEGITGLGAAMAGRTFELARMVRELDIMYFDQDGKEFEGWNTTSGKHLDLLPSFVRISLTIAGSSSGKQTFTTGVHPQLSGASR